MKFEEILNAVKSSINGLITTDMSSEQIDNINSINSKVDELKASNDEILAENTKLKEMLINNLKNGGTTEKPSDEHKEKSLQDSINKVVANRNKK